jgi:isoprenylcysteine carboxyl methyltransferase (ICMT) family protein YpbQ
MEKAMSNKLKLVYNKVYKYTKGKPFLQVIAELYAFAILLPAAVTGILFMFYTVIFVGV